MMHQFSYRVFLIIFLSFFSLVGMADCPIKVETPDIRSAGRSLEEAANAVENGLKKFDPIALNKLLEENESLRNTLSSIKVRLEGFSQGFTIIHLKNQRLRLKVIDYSGDLIVKAYINEPSNWFLDFTLMDRNVHLPIDYPKIMETEWGKFRELSRHPTAFGWRDNEPGAALLFARGRKAIADIYKAKVNEAFNNFLVSTHFFGSPKQTTSDIGPNLGRPGKHNIIISITPIKNDQHGRWFFRAELLTEKPQGEPEHLRAFDAHPGKPEYADYQLGTVLPPIILPIEVEAADLKKWKNEFPSGPNG